MAEWPWGIVWNIGVIARRTIASVCRAQCRYRFQARDQSIALFMLGTAPKTLPLSLYLRDVRTGRLEQTLYCGTIHRTSVQQLNALPQHGNSKTLHHSLTLTCKDSPSYGSGA